MFLGDFNLDPHTDTRSCAQVFPRLTDGGFKLASPQGDWSYHTGDGGGTRVDHAFASPAVSIKDARYIYKTGRHILAGPPNRSGPALSDHAVLSIRVQHPVAVQRTRLPDTAAA